MNGQPHAARASRINAVLEWLQPIASPVADVAEFSRWISARNADDPDQSDDWCTDCARKEVERLNAISPAHEYFVDGGWGSTTDVPPYCCKCGKTLDDELTSYAIESEVDHYSGNSVTLRGKTRGHRAFRFVQMLRSADFDALNPSMWRFFRKIERMHERTTKI